MQYEMDINYNVKDLPVETVFAMKQLAVKLRKKHPNWKDERLAKKVAAQFNIKLIGELPAGQVTPLSGNKSNARLVKK